MDEFSTEQEQIEELRKWWNENGRFVITGLVLGLAMLFGYRAWQDARHTRAEQASLQFGLLQDAVNAADLATAEGILATLEAEYSATPYMDQAYLAMARMRMATGDIAGAESMLTAAMDSGDDQLARVARLRLARLHLDAGDPDAALTVIDGASHGSFAGLFAELRGDALAAAGRTDEARAAYEEAMRTGTEGLVDQDFVEMKLAALPAPAAPATSGN